MTNSINLKNRELVDACEMGNAKRVRVLIAEGADVNCVDGFMHKNTPMIRTVICSRDRKEGDYLGVIEALFVNLADLDRKDGDGKTALHWASGSGYEEIVDFLLKLKAKPALADDRGATPIMLAAYNGHKDVVEKLIHHGGLDWDASVKQNGLTALGCAAIQEHDDIVDLLIANGCDRMVITPMIGIVSDKLSLVYKRRERLLQERRNPSEFFDAEANRKGLQECRDILREGFAKEPTSYRSFKAMRYAQGKNYKHMRRAIGSMLSV